MHTPNLFEQITHGMGDPQKIGQWLKTAWPLAADGQPADAPAKAWLGSIETLLQGAEALRHMQLDAIHKAQQRTSHLAKSLGDSRNPAAAVTALQTFAQDNMTEALQYWSAYREIVQEAEIHLLGDGLRADDEAPRGSSRSRASHKKRARTSNGKSARAT
jgi:Phasin protein